MNLLSARIAGLSSRPSLVRLTSVPPVKSSSLRRYWRSSTRVSPAYTEPSNTVIGPWVRGIPEVFLKALNLARNVGNRVGELVTVDMDFMRHYRPAVNVVQRPTQGDGKGYQLTGHHEIMFPLLCAAVLDALRTTPSAPARRRRTARLKS